jgi:hypothetical protein
MSKLVSQFPPHRCLSEPEILFHPERDGDRHKHPLEGLLQFGPYSRSLVNAVIDPIRIAVIAPHDGLTPVRDLILEMDQRHKPRERPQYLREFPGISRIFGVRAVLGSVSTQFELHANTDQEISNCERPHLFLAERIVAALNALEARRHEFDVVFIYLPARWERCFEGGDDEAFDLHDYLKSVCAVRNMPMQIIRDDGAIAYHCRCSVMWRLSLALYCKAGGVPWKLADVPSDTAFIGISYAVRATENAQGRFVTCCSQVFDSDGAGLEFILYETDEVQIIRNNPFLNRSDMRKVMARSLALYQRQHAGRTPKHVVVHKSTEFKNEEVDGCFDAWQSAEGLDLVHVQQHVMWRGVKLEQATGNKKGKAPNYPCERGTLLQIGDREVLLWTQGNAPAVTGGKDFFKEGKSIPSPLLLKRYAGHGAWDEECRHILGLTKMNWNNDALYDRLPVTMGYATILAQAIKRMSHLAHRPYQLRFFM